MIKMTMMRMTMIMATMMMMAIRILDGNLRSGPASFCELLFFEYYHCHHSEDDDRDDDNDGDDDGDDDDGDQNTSYLVPHHLVNSFSSDKQHIFPFR